MCGRGDEKECWYWRLCGRRAEEESETERLGREMARPILFDGRPWARVRRSLDSCTMRAWFAVAKG
jgi:hypothetical protein